MNVKRLIAVGVVAGLVQVAAGITMYLAGVYFVPWSMFISLFLLLLCIVVGTKWYAARATNGKLSYGQAFTIGLVISISTGLIYALYNLISISWFYPNFLDELVRARRAQAFIPGADSFETMRAQVSALNIALPNLIRLSLFGSFLSLLTAQFLKRAKAA